MQQPTCTNIRVRSTVDAHKIFGAVYTGALQMVSRRLDADERLALRSGCIYAWEERGPHSEITGLGIERFTEGRRWSPSRVRDEFLFYYEKYSPPPDVNQTNGSAERQPPRDWDPLVKQTYSVWVETEKGRRKWHLTAYFTQATIDQLGTIDDIPAVRDVVVPDGMFKSTRVGKSRNRSDADHTRTDVGKAATSSISRTYAPFSSPYQYQQAQSGSPSTTPVLMHEPYQNPAEHRPPAFESSPSPVSPHYSANSTYPSHGHTNSSSSSYPGYGDSMHSMSQPMTSPSHPAQYQSHPTDNQNYYQTSPSSWSANHTYYGSPSHNQLPPLSPTSPTAYGNPVSTQGHNHNSGSPYHYHSPAPPNNNHYYSHGYSLNSALASPAVLPETDLRGAPISPLHTSDRSHHPNHHSHHHEGHLHELSGSPPGVSGDPEVALAPLNDLKRPSGIRYRREPADEKTLRLLRAPQSTTSLHVDPPSRSTGFDHGP